MWSSPRALLLSCTSLHRGQRSWPSRSHRTIHLQCSCLCISIRSSTNSGLQLEALELEVPELGSPRPPWSPGFLAPGLLPLAPAPLVPCSLSPPAPCPLCSLALLLPALLAPPPWLLASLPPLLPAPAPCLLIPCSPLALHGVLAPMAPGFLPQPKLIQQPTRHKPQATTRHGVGNCVSNWIRYAII